MLLQQDPGIAQLNSTTQDQLGQRQQIQGDGGISVLGT